MMARRRSRLRLAVRHTAQTLRKWSKTRLIRLILRLEAARISRTGRRVVRRVARRVRRAGKRKFKIGSIHVTKNGRRFKITSKGARFLKGKTRRTSRTRRRTTHKRRARSSRRR